MLRASGSWGMASVSLAAAVVAASLGVATKKTKVNQEKQR